MPGPEVIAGQNTNNPFGPLSKHHLLLYSSLKPQDTFLSNDIEFSIFEILSFQFDNVKYFNNQYIAIYTTYTYTQEKLIHTLLLHLR